MYELKTIDYLFLKYGTIFIKLKDITDEFYPNLCQEKVLEKARTNKFPFPCTRLDDSQKSPLFVNIHDLAKAFDEIYNASSSIFHNKIKSSIKTLG